MNKTISAIENKQWAKAEALLKDYENPALKTAYLWRYYQTAENYSRYQISFDDVSTFVVKHPDFPNIGRIVKLAEQSIQNSENASVLLNWFNKYPPITAQGMRFYAESLLRLNRRAEFEKMINDWWATTLMGRADQKYIYRLYGRHINRSTHLKRLNKLLLNKSYTNARAIANVLGGGVTELVEARIALIANKGGVDRLVAAVPKHLQKDAGLQFDRLRWRRKKNLDGRAIEILNNPPPVETIPNLNDWWKERHIIIRRLIEKKQYKAAAQLAANHQQKEGFSYAQAQWLAGWLALKYLDQPTQAFARFQELSAKVGTPISKARAAYWAGRAAEAIGGNTLANTWYRQAAQYQTTYYGQAAGDKIGRQIATQYMYVPKYSAAEEIEFLKDDKIKIAWAYHNAGYDDISGDFLWRFAQEKNTAKAQIFSIKQAVRMKNEKDVVVLSKKASQKGWFMTKDAYPKLTQGVARHMTLIDPHFVHAIIRQESQFNPRAQSPVGARGLMQLMPATAKQVADVNGIKHRRAWLTERPDHNVRLGSLFLKQLLDKYKGDTMLATAAYNAGPGRVTEWIKTYGDPRTSQITHMDWAELVPFYETRNYIQRVDEAMNVYKNL